jgi:hypothetical protein
MTFSKTWKVSLLWDFCREVDGMARDDARQGHPLQELSDVLVALATLGSSQDLQELGGREDERVLDAALSPSPLGDELLEGQVLVLIARVWETEHRGGRDRDGRLDLAIAVVADEADHLRRDFVEILARGREETEGEEVLLGLYEVRGRRRLVALEGGVLVLVRLRHVFCQATTPCSGIRGRPCMLGSLSENVESVETYHARSKSLRAGRLARKSLRQGTPGLTRRDTVPSLKGLRSLR